MKNILAKVQDGSFAKQWIAECESGGENFLAKKRRQPSHRKSRTGVKKNVFLAQKIKLTFKHLGIISNV